MNKKLMNKIMDELEAEASKAIRDSFKQAITSAFPSLPPIPQLSWSHTPNSQLNNLSPTDKDAKGMFEYQEPEVDEQGTYYGYKVLRLTERACSCSECRKNDGVLSSPSYMAYWYNGELTADEEPNENSMHGIHCTKRYDHEQLYFYMVNCIYSTVVVRCALSGTIVETEQGFRAQHAQITEVLYNGHWESYQDYQERTAANSRRDSEEKRIRRANYNDIYADWNP